MASRGLRVVGRSDDGALRVLSRWQLDRNAVELLAELGARWRLPGEDRVADLEIDAEAGGEPSPQWLGRRLGALACRGLATRPVLGGVLVGGESRRMGRDKALLRIGERRWVDRQSELLGAEVDEVLLLGRSIAPWPGLPDADASGPLAGLLALARARPGATLVVIAVDQPLLTAPALRWLLRRRRVGVDVVMGSLDGQLAPLPVVVEPGAHAALERLVGRHAGPRALIEEVPSLVAEVPSRLARAWRDFDRPEDLLP